MNYNYFNMKSMPECQYPTEYQQMYGHMIPWMQPEATGPMVFPMMYPDIYYRLYPYVSRICDRMDNPYIIYPAESQIESMINECYDMAVREMPDLEEYAGAKVPENMSVEIKQNIAFRRPILRDLIAIILLSELFRRRRGRFFNRYPYSGSPFSGYPYSNY